MTLRDDVNAALDDARGIIASFGLRTFVVKIRRRAWSGGKPGIGQSIDTDLTITPPPRVEAVGAREIAASGGTYQDGDIRLTKITPAYDDGFTTGGYTKDQLKLTIAHPYEELLYVLTGDDGETHATFVSGRFDDKHKFGYEIVVRRRRDTP
jgi:hypothetical protein